MTTSTATDLRQSILDVARHLLVTYGYEQLSMRKIAAEIGCSAMAIYVHFENKDALVHVLIEEGMERMYGALQGAAAREEEPQRQLDRVCRAFFEFALMNPEYYTVMHIVDSARLGRYPVEKYRRARRSLELLEEILRAGHARGQLLLVGDALVGASVVWAMLHGAASLIISRRLDTGIDRGAFVEAHLSRILASVQA